MEDILYTILDDKKIEEYFEEMEDDNPKENYNDFDEYYYDTIHQFIDWYVDNNDDDFEEYIDAKMMFDCIRYQQENYGESSLNDTDCFVSFQNIVLYINILKAIMEEEDKYAIKIKKTFKINYENCIWINEIQYHK